MNWETDKDGNYVFDGKIAIAGGEVGESYTVTLRNDGWEPIGYISGHTTLGDRVEKLERLVRVLADALGVNEEFLSSVIERA